MVKDGKEMTNFGHDEHEKFRLKQTGLLAKQNVQNGTKLICKVRVERIAVKVT